MSSTAELMRAWRGPAILTYGFRPFFFGSAVWATISMALWIPMLSGALTLPTAFDAVSWHAHEFLFGYLAAVIAGFLLTAVPNWTGRLPIVGWPLGGLFLLWVAGRVVVAGSAGLPPLLVALVDMAFALVLGAVLAREIIAGKNWRNLIVLAMLVVFTLGNAVFHWEAAQGGYAAQGVGLRIGVGAGVMMIAVIGGRIVPSFTRNWLVKRNSARLPTPPMQKFDKAALLLLLVALLLWVVVPAHPITGAALVAAGVVHSVRLGRWAGHLTFAEPLVTVLHVGYAFVPLGALIIGVDILWVGTTGAAAAQHLWMAGAFGLMTLAVMTRATLGHTGQALTAKPGTILIYSAMLVAVAARVFAGVWPALASEWHIVAGLAWMLAFGGFAVVYGALLLRVPPNKRTAG
ncbi:NnrS family protein [Marivita sp. S2033]|uniref:NnrS family protein n=1 Tax=Marivita sp. S2033 TaxID=3373187 RepID=UPI0039827281